MKIVRLLAVNNRCMRETDISRGYARRYVVGYPAQVSVEALKESNRHLLNAFYRHVCRQQRQMRAAHIHRMKHVSKLSYGTVHERKKPQPQL